MTKVFFDHEMWRFPVDFLSKQSNEMMIDQWNGEYDRIGCAPCIFDGDIPTNNDGDSTRKGTKMTKHYGVHWLTVGISNYIV